MDVEAFARGFVSDPLVEVFAEEHRERLAAGGGDQKLGVILTCPTKANVSYGIRALEYGESLVGGGECAPVELYLPTQKGEFEIIRTSAGLRAAKEDGLYWPP